MANYRKDRKIALSELTKADFQLPGLAPVLQRARDDLHNGRGLVLLKGIDPSRYSRKENFNIFAGLSTYLAEQIGYHPGGRLIGKCLSMNHVGLF